MSDFSSLMFYIFSFLLSAVFYALYNKNNKKIFLVLSFGIPMLIGGLRYNVGTDYANYVLMYEHNSNVDVGFNIISWIAHLFSNSQVLFFIYNLLTLFFTYLGLKNLDKETRALAFICFMFLFYTTSFNAMRQMLAVSIIFFAYKYIVGRKFWKYLLFTILATIFHTTAICALILYPILISDKKKVKFLLLFGLLVFVLNFENIIGLISGIRGLEHFDMYSEFSNNKVEFNNYSFFLELLCLGYFAIHKKRLSDFNKNNLVYFFIYIMGVLLTLTGFINPYVKRIALYFTMTEIILFANIPQLYNDRKNKLLNCALIFCFVVGKFVISTYILGQANIIPYRMIGM